MTFRAKIVIGFALIQAILLLILIVVGVNVIRSSNMEKLQDHSISMVDLFAQVVVTPVVSSDLASLQEMTNALSEHPGVTFVRVTSVEGTILAESGDVRGGREHEGDVFIATASILVGAQTFGILEIGQSTVEVEAVIVDVTRDFVIIALVGIGLTIGFSLIMSTYLSRRLQALETGAAKIAGGDLGYQISHMEKDELGAVATAFNNMSTRLSRVYGELAESEQRFETVSDHLPAALYRRIIRPDSSTYFDYVSPGVEEIFGLPAEAYIENSDLFNDAITEETRARLSDDWTRSIETGEPMNHEYEIVRPDGKRRWLRSWAGVHTTDDGNTVFDGLVLDVTKDKELDLIKTEFVSIVNHELRTPLTSIQGALALISNAPTDAIDSKYRGMVEIAYRNCGRLAQLVNDILDMDKIASGNVVLRCARQSALDLVHEGLESTQSFAEAMGKGLTVVGGAKDVQIDVDGNRIVQVLTNLMSNAVKFEPKGGQVTIEIAVRDQTVRFSVTDHGEGVPLEFHDRIFDKFAQAEDTRTRKHEGTGLGLAISKALVEAHGGEIGFESTPGVRTTFWFDLQLSTK